jgi:DNA polymerase I-like protein with 3'-5' exonuclease and polymerase domains
MPAHVHDEVLCEVDEDKADECLKDMTRIMTTPPEWAIGLPLEVDLKLMRRYSK